MDIYGGRDPRDIPAYTIAEVARLAGVTESRLETWIRGRYFWTKSGKKKSPPIIDVAPKDANGRQLLTFNNATEAHVLASLRLFHGVPLINIRKGVDYLKREFGMEHPLTYKGFKTDGIHIFIEHLDVILNATDQGQAVFGYMEAYLDRLRWDERSLTDRIYPVTRRQDILIDPRQISQEPTLIMVDPRISFGRPAITGTGIPTSSIIDRFRAGDSMTEIAADLDRKIEEIEEAVRYESQAA